MPHALPERRRYVEGDGATLDAMVGGRRTAETAHAHAEAALAQGKRRTDAGRPRTAVGAVLALQRAAGNTAVSALVAARFRSPSGDARTEIDAALREVRRDEPVIDTLEKGLRRAKAVGIPVELEGPKPPASALAVTPTGFGPESVAGKKPVPPPKPVPKASPLGKAAAGKAGGKAPGAGKVPAPPAAGGAGAAPAAPAPMSADQLLQPPVPPTTVAPDQDPAFTTVTKALAGFGGAKKAHPPAAAKAGEAQGAALAPADDLGAQAKEAKVASMGAQQPGSFDKKAFIAAVKAAIEAKSPSTLKEADEYKKSGKAGQVKGEVKGLVTKGKEGQTKDIEGATEAPPDSSKAVPKQVTPMAAEDPGQAAAIPAVGAVPKPAPAEQVNLAAGKVQADQEMAEADVSEQQLAQSNEPEFQQAVADKKVAAQHADTAPGEYRKQEQEVLQQGKAEAAGETTAGVAGMQGAKRTALAGLVADKGKTKSKDEARRAAVTAKVQAIYAATEADVKKFLDGIDPKVDAEFERGEAKARAEFENFVAAKMSAYKKDRYSGWLGGFRWARDKIAGMPAKVNEFYKAGRELYLQQMDGVISRVATIVGDDLTAAKKRITAGRSEIDTYVKSLPKDLKKVGSEAAKEIGDRFQELEQEVESKQESVVDALATKYVDARKGLDERIEELQAENRGLVDKAISAIKAVVGTIRQLAAMLRDVLSRVAGVVGQIIKNPIGFLENLIAGVKGGILKFKDQFVDHLKKGLLRWLFGALAEGGVELPDSFDLKGVIKLLASLFGLTWANIRNRLVKQVGAPALSAMEKGVSIFQTLAGPQGVAGLWEMMLEKLGDIKQMILDKIQEYVKSSIITAGITWLIGLLNPAAAFVKACKLIYDVVMFFVNNKDRIKKLVDTILDSVSDIVRGNVSGVVGKVNDVLGQMVPVIIGFLASVAGLGGIGQKIRKLVETLQKPFNQALDFVIKTGLKLAGPFIRGLKSVSGKVKAKVAAGKAYVKGKVEAGKAYAKAKVEAGKAYVKGKWEALRRPFRFGEEQHSLIATSGDNPRLLIASEEKKAVATMTDEVTRAAKSADPERLRMANALLAACVDMEDKLKAAARTKDAEAIAAARARFGLVLGALKEYGRTYRRRGLVPETDLAEGSIRPYNLQPKGGKGRFEHEHIVPGALFAAWMGLERASAAISAMYANMTTVTWKYKAARIKTASDAAKWTAMKVKRDAFLERPEVAKVLKARGGWKPGQQLPNPPDVFGTLDDLKDDRVRASIKAAQESGSKVTAAQIEAAASAQLLHLKELFRQLHAGG